VPIFAVGGSLAVADRFVVPGPMWAGVSQPEVVALSASKQPSAWRRRSSASRTWRSAEMSSPWCLLDVRLLQSGLGRAANGSSQVSPPAWPRQPSPRGSWRLPPFERWVIK